jgi:UPF0755 protein
MKKLVLSLLALGMAFALIVGGYLYQLHSNAYSGADVFFTVKPGEGFSSINGRLSQAGLISNPRYFHYLAKYKNAIGQIKAGTFKIAQGFTMNDVLMELTGGKPILISITIPEGKNIYEVSKILANQKLGLEQDFLALMKDESFVKEMGLPGHSVEGYLYPETYKIAPYTSARDILISMIKLFKQKTEMFLTSHPTLSSHQIVTLASVVEKETGVKEERPLIASVFLNRLKKKMRLQSDPTTIYGIYETYQGNIKKEHLLKPTPYNTYTVAALPIGPIANPSLEAIKAVLEPAPSDYLFFVSRNDGTHIFTTNYKDHLKAVEDFQKNPLARKGKSWRQLKKN